MDMTGKEGKRRERGEGGIDISADETRRLTWCGAVSVDDILLSGHSHS